MYEKLDNLILSIVHELQFGEFNMTGDGRSRLLENWYNEYKSRIHEAVDEICEEKGDSSEESGEEGSSDNSNDSNGEDAEENS